MSAPSLQPLSNAERAQCAALAALLHASARLGSWSLLLAALAMLALLAQLLPHVYSMYTCISVVLISLIERYLSIRLHIDQHLFTSLARGDIASLHELDQALATLGLRAAPRPAANDPSAPAPRPLASRIAGTRRLLLQHALAVGLQTLAMLATLICILKV